MWRKLVELQRRWGDAQLALLEQPALAAAAAPAGFRRRYAEKVVALSPVERQQLIEFACTYRGRAGHLLMAKLVLAFSAYGVLLHTVFVGISWGRAIGIANLMGFGLAIAICGAWFNYRKLARGKWTLATKVILYGMMGAAMVLMLGMWTTDQPPAAMLQAAPRVFALVFGIGLLAVVPMIAIAALRQRQYELLTAQLQADAERERLARELSESKLRLLRAQIEPHFLFNTLGAVQQLAQHGAPRAADLTADLIAFLRASLGDMRSDQVSLKAEFSLVESYLKVMGVRLGGRLAFRMALAPDLETVRVPSMILLTLAENAIKHGIEPALRGGEVVVAARIDAGVLRLTVADSGVGMRAQPDTGTGAGMGLDNVRHRLRLAYGEAAGLALEEGEPGLAAVITIPHVAAAAA